LAQEEASRGNIFKVDHKVAHTQDLASSGDAFHLA
jgi:hypothetical protein